MSLIHDALKKAETEKKPETSNKEFLPNPIIPNRPKPPTRTLLLYIILALSTLFFVYVRFIKKPTSMPTPTPITPAGGIPSPDDPAFLKKAALNLFNEGKLEQSLATWQKLILLLPTDADVYNNLGLTLKKLGKKEEAYQAYTKALALQHDFPEALNNLGVLHLGDGNKQKAKPLFQEAIQLKPDYADSHLNLAVLLEQEGDIKQAHGHYLKFLELSPDSDAALKEKIQKKIDLLAK